MTGRPSPPSPWSFLWVIPESRGKERRQRRRSAGGAGPTYDALLGWRRDDAALERLLGRQLLMETQEIAVTSADREGFTPEHGQGGLGEQTGTTLTHRTPLPHRGGSQHISAFHPPGWRLCRPRMRSCHLLEESRSESKQPEPQTFTWESNDLCKRKKGDGPTFSGLVTATSTSNRSSPSSSSSWKTALLPSLHTPATVFARPLGEEADPYLL